MSDPVYLVLNGPHKGQRHPAHEGGTVLQLVDPTPPRRVRDLTDVFSPTYTTYTLRVLAVDDPDGTRKANRFWLTADTPTSGIQMLDLLIDLAEEARQDD